MHLPLTLHIADKLQLSVQMAHNTPAYNSLYFHSNRHSSAVLTPISQSARVCVIVFVDATLRTKIFILPATEDICEN